MQHTFIENADSSDKGIVCIFELLLRGQVSKREDMLSAKFNYVAFLGLGVLPIEIRVASEVQPVGRMRREALGATDDLEDKMLRRK